jgi:hypothetical protein
MAEKTTKVDRLTREWRRVVKYFRSKLAKRGGSPEPRDVAGFPAAAATMRAYSRG